MDSQTEALIKSCVTCQMHDKTAVICIPPLQPVPFPESAWEKVVIDIVGPFDTSPIDCHYAITLIDYFSKWPEVAFTSQISSAPVIKFLPSLLKTEENAKELVSDNGSHFTSLEFETFLAERNILHRRSSLYYPQANGEIERFNRSLKESLQTAKLEGQLWITFTTDFLQAYRATRHATTQRSPAELLHGKQMITKLNIAGLLKARPEAPAEDDVRKTVEQNQANYKAFTDKWWGAKEPKFQCGSFVRIQKPGILRKGDHKFTAPLKIIEKKGPYTYRLSDGRVWNASYLAPAYATRGDYANTQSALDDFTIVATQQDIALEPGLERRPVRPRRPPVWTRDCVM
ncbi:unnamed protein product [Lepidochelys kempii]